jgi:hypothetical protein
LNEKIKTKTEESEGQKKTINSLTTELEKLKSNFAHVSERRAAIEIQFDNLKEESGKKEKQLIVQIAELES